MQVSSKHTSSEAQSSSIAHLMLVSKVHSPASHTYPTSYNSSQSASMSHSEITSAAIQASQAPPQSIPSSSPFCSASSHVTGVTSSSENAAYNASAVAETSLFQCPSASCSSRMNDVAASISAS